ncbi:MAG: allophycocyanin, partial [Candidatus Synechococcus spongiarum 142]
MQDAITSVINSSDVQGLYLDDGSMSKLQSYFRSGELRVRAAATISANASAIVRDAVAKALLYSDITR